MPPEPEITVLHEVPKAPDLVTRLLRVHYPEQGITVVELRDYVPSTDKYGRGYWVPLDSVHALGDYLSTLEVASDGRP